MKIYIVTDLEGASGVFKFEQTREMQGPLFREAMGYLMGDIAAVVKGLRAAGADEIVVLDGHDGGNNFIPHLMEPGAKYITGKPREGMLWGLDRTFDGLVLLGFHAMWGTLDGVLYHTQSSKAEYRCWYNGVESGELAQCAAVAGHYGVPPILVTADEAGCREATRFFGRSCVTVAVKKGISREAAALLPFEDSRKRLYEGAKRAVAAIPKCKPYRLKMPVRAKVQYFAYETSPSQTRVVTKEAKIADIRKLVNF